MSHNFNRRFRDASCLGKVHAKDFDQRSEYSVLICEALLQQPNENVFKNITRDETWAYGYDVETK
jgi:hypothetical protein